MRIVREIQGKPCKVTVFSWNEKYLIKLEFGPFEQTFKVSMMDYLEEELVEILSDKFISEAMDRFQTMGESLRTAINSF